MPINVDLLRAADAPPLSYAWTRDDVILYHLGLGAGLPADDPGELAYTYEPNLKVVPSFATIPAQGTLAWLLAAPGLDVPLAKLLHGEQDTELYRAVPVEAETRTTARVAEVYDKGEGKAAIVVLEATTADAEGDRLFTNRFTLFLRGEGGCGGARVAPPRDGPPSRSPDIEVDCVTMPQQALLYRLSGDKNPMHADPEFARAAGFERPFLHGLCSYGIACKAIVDAALDGDVQSVWRFGGRFAGIFFPGETLRVQLWRERGRILGTAIAKERQAPVLANLKLEHV